MKHRALIFIAGFVVALASTSATAQTLRHTYVSTDGNDANDCSRNTPCLTFAGAIPKTNTGGEITALDSGNYGVVTINKSVTVQAAPGVHAQLGNGTSQAAVSINASTLSVVVLRNLFISRVGPMLRGIEFNSGNILHVENCVVTGFGSTVGYGIRASGACNESGACLHLFIKDTFLRENGNGIMLESARAVIDHSRIENNTTGLRAGTWGGATIRDSVVAGHRDYGIISAGTPSSILVENCLVTANGTGIWSSGYQGLPSVVYVSNTMIVGNTTGVSAPNNISGEIISFGNNRLANNTTNGAFTSTIQQQ